MVPCRLSRTLVSALPTSTTPLVFRRHKSLTASIERGVRDTFRSDRSSNRYNQSSRRERPARDAGEGQEFRKSTRIPEYSTKSFRPGERTDSGRGPERARSTGAYEPTRESKSRGAGRDGTYGNTRAFQNDKEPYSRRDDGWERPRSGMGTARAGFRGGPDRYEMTQGPRLKDAREGSAYSKPRGFERGAREESAYSKPRGFERDPRPYSSGDDGQSQRPSRFGSTAPETLPYTTAASEFLYGYQTIMAALKAGRRRLYKLYIHERGQNHEGASALIARAKIANVKIQEVDDDYLRLMDKASSGRPHNGYILETSPLPRPPITKLGSSSVANGNFVISLDKQSREDAQVNGTQTRYMYKSSGWRHPLLLYVDGVLDEGNLGAIARSAYFLGVDAIATPTRQSAPWSSIALKASAGAAEAVPIFTVSKPADFLVESAREGWRIYASDAIPPEKQPTSSAVSSEAPQKDVDTASKLVYTYARSAKRVPAGHCPLDAHPTILMMGAEGEGLRGSLLNQAHFKVGIRAGREKDEVGVDSLNVSVAASLLCYEILQKPRVVRKPGELLF